MTCRRAFEADLVAVLHGAGAPDFLVHAQTCAECAAEVRVWRELDALLHAGAEVAGSTAHPAPEALVALVDAPGSLAPGVRTTIERHVAGCPACADEARVLRGFDGATLAAAPAARRDDVGAEGAPLPRAVGPSRTVAATAPRVPARHRWVGRVLWHPAFAYALALLLAVPLVREMLPRRVPSRVSEETPIAGARPERPRVLGEAREPEAWIAAPPAVKVEPPAAPPAVEVEAALDAPELRASDARPTRADAAPAAVPVLRAAGGAAPSPVVLDLQPGKPTVYGAEVVGPPVTLRVGRPVALAPGPLSVTVRTRADRREITAHASSADAIALDMPAGWLAPGDYVVTVQPVAGGPPALLGFSVRAPTGARTEPVKRSRGRMSSSGLPVPVPTAKP